MIGEQYTVIVRRAVPLHAGTYAVFVIRDHGASEMVAAALEIDDAMQLGIKVRARLDRCADIAAVRLALENGGVPA